MKVRDLMCRTVRTCAPDESLSRAAQEMWDGDCGSVPVVDETRRVVGMVTDRDICMALYLNNGSASSLSVREVMGSPIHHCSPDDEIDRPMAIMRNARVRRVPVVDSDGTLCGLLSINDLILAASNSTRKSPGEVSTSALMDTMKGICEHAAGEVPVS